MSDPAFFGYGSLVNLRTHDYASPRKAKIKGWRRIWQQSGNRPVAFLSVHPVQNAEIEGLIAEVPGANWAALDEREHAYNRVDVTKTLNADTATAIYVGDPSMMAPRNSDHPILLSYLDVVVQGYLNEFGKSGVARFFETTDGWDAPILNDRIRPIYPRHLDLTQKERALTDAFLKSLGAEVITTNDPQASEFWPDP